MAETTWESLPPALRGRCMRAGSPADQKANFAACTAFTQAMLLTDPELTDPQLTVHINDIGPAFTTVLRWARTSRFSLQLCGRGEPAEGEGAPEHAPLEPLCDLLLQEGLVLSQVRKVCCKGLLFTTGSLSALLPSLQELQLEACRVQPGVLPLAGCTQLRELVLDSDSRHGAEVPPLQPWHMQLSANLPSLSSLTMHICYHPASLLPQLAGQLTQLRLISVQSNHHWIVGEFPTPSVYPAALEHVAQLTNLRVLEMDSCTSEFVTTLSTTLPHLQQLILRNCTCWLDDTTLPALLQCPNLTSLTWGLVGQLKQSYANEPCSWQELELGMLKPQDLARLPLHSVTQLRLTCLTVKPKTTADDISADVANINRSPAGRAAAGVDKAFCIGLDEDSRIMGGVDVRQLVMPPYHLAAQLVSLAAPLVPQDITKLILDCRYGAWPVDAALLIALQQAAPPTISTLNIDRIGGIIDASFWTQLVVSFPQLKSLELGSEGEPCSPAEVGSYYSAARAAHQGPGAPKVADIKIISEDGERDIDWQELVDSFSELNQQLLLQGLTATVTLQ